MTTTEDNHFQWSDGPDHVRVSCTRCGWEKISYGSRIDAVRLVGATETHDRNDHPASGMAGNPDLELLRSVPGKRAPALCDPVHYVSYGSPGGEYTSECRAAVVTDLPGDDVVGVMVLNPTGIFFKSVAYDETKSGGTWHWPCG